ncbi:DsbA family protein [Sulfurovum sp.]|uniref:DsbA family protein n=1 Tax=Sulfurovum sp. TaxID=1969726 RepID=UPI002867B146|nr:DsbA family protein [Sulfurovum sp.]
MKKEIIFVVDPMCSWCWGFAPVIETLRKNDAYTYSLVVGGLRTKGQMTWDESSKGYLQRHWEQVYLTTGQPFSNALFQKEHFDYDTYPACKAVVSVRELFGMQKSFEYLHSLQNSFYTKGQDITQLEVLMELLDLIDLDVEKFKTFYNSDRAQLLMEHDFSKARSMGANAFPSVVIIDEEGHMVCQKGYRSIENMKKLLKDEDA